MCNEASLKRRIYAFGIAVQSSQVRILYRTSIVFLPLRPVLRVEFFVDTATNIGCSGDRFNGLIIPMIDARRMEVYGDIYY
jgi:hypothetical protein